MSTKEWAFDAINHRLPRLPLEGKLSAKLTDEVGGRQGVLLGHLCEFVLRQDLIRPRFARPPEGELPEGQERPPWGVPKGEGFSALRRRNAGDGVPYGCEFHTPSVGAINDRPPKNEVFRIFRRKITCLSPCGDGFSPKIHGRSMIAPTFSTSNSVCFGW